MTNKKKEYNLIPIVPVINITHIVTAYRNKVIYGFDNGESHDFWEFNLSQREKVSENIGNGEAAETEHVLKVIAPNTFHGGQPINPREIGQKVTIVSFRCDSELLQVLENKRIVLLSFETREFREIVQIAESYLTYENSSNNLRSDVQQFQLQLVKNRLEIFIINLLKNHEFINEYLERDVDYMCNKLAKEVEAFFEEHIKENLLLKDISNHFFVSESSLKKAFRQKYNAGVIDYFIKMKINYAKKMIADSGKSMSEIAEQLGFSSVYYFSRVFRAKTGMSPMQYAKSLK